MKIKLSAVALLLGTVFSSSAFATSNVWDSATPWESATLTDFAGWNYFNGTYDTAGDDVGSGIGSIQETTGMATVTTTGNIYSGFNTSSYIVTLGGTVGGIFDVYLRIATGGNAPTTIALLDGVSATSTTLYAASDRESYWVWNNVTGAATYTFTFSNSNTNVSLDQLQVATVAAVPEPSTYGMMAIGLGLVGFVGRRSRKKIFA